MVLGLSHPRGPFAWADAIGLDHVLAVLEALCDEYREERYRPAPALRRLVRGGAARAARRRGLLRLRGRDLSAARSHVFAARGRLLIVSDGATPFPALPRRPPRRRVALPGVLGRAVGRRGLLPGDVHRGAARLPAPARGLEPARVGADDRPPQGARRAPRARRRALPVAELDAVDERVAAGAQPDVARDERAVGRRAASCRRASARRSCCASSPICPTARSRPRSAARRRRRGARCTRD